MSVGVLTPTSVPQEIEILKAQVRGLQQFAVGGTIPLDEKAKDQNYNDTCYVGTTGRQQIDFFVNRLFPAGTPQAGVLKSNVEFNLTTPGTFPAPQEYTMYGLMFEIMPSVADGAFPLSTDIEMLRAYSVLTCIQGRKSIWSIPLDRFSAAGFIGAANAAAGDSMPNFGPPGITDFFPFSSGIAIKPGLTFSWQLETAPEYNAEEQIRCRIELIGQLVTNTR